MYKTKTKAAPVLCNLTVKKLKITVWRPNSAKKHPGGESVSRFAAGALCKYSFLYDFTFLYSAGNPESGYLSSARCSQAAAAYGFHRS